VIFDEHPLFAQDIDDIAFFIYEVSGSRDAAVRRLTEIDRLRHAIMARPLSGVRLDGDLTGCLARHGGRDNKLTILWQPNEAQDRGQLILASFGGYDWMGMAMERI